MGRKNNVRQAAPRNKVGEYTAVKNNTDIRNCFIFLSFILWASTRKMLKKVKLCTQILQEIVLRKDFFNICSMLNLLFKMPLVNRCCSCCFVKSVISLLMKSDFIMIYLVAKNNIMALNIKITKLIQILHFLSLLYLLKYKKLNVKKTIPET